MPIAGLSVVALVRGIHDDSDPRLMLDFWSDVPRLPTTVRKTIPLGRLTRYDG